MNQWKDVRTYRTRSRASRPARRVNHRARPAPGSKPKTRPRPAARPPVAGLILPPEPRRYLRVRLARLAGHLQTVIRMIETGTDFKDVMTQLAAVRSGLTGVTARMAEMYVTAWVDAGMTQQGDRRSLETLLNVLKFLARAY
ncbi:MAG: metal-sensing transcriptional repressor [Acidobacteria bacterium]|nr:metal-sensing transcriptional repressor [Acidobacteriota bacterium]MDW7983388.1 metal-sensing transcriptional repressor [Acidobacteriota bacterium]